MATEGTNKNNKANEEALNQTKVNFSNDEMKSNSQITVESQKVNQDVVNPIKKVDDRLVFSLDVFNELSEEDYPSPIPKKDDELANANTVSNSIFDEIEKEEKIKHPSIINEIKKETDKDGKGEFEYLNDEKDRILLEDIEKELQDKKHSEEIHNDKESISASTESTLSKDDKSDLSENNKSKEVGESVIDMVNTQTSANKKSSFKQTPVFVMFTGDAQYSFPIGDKYSISVGGYCDFAFLGISAKKSHDRHYFYSGGI